MQDYSGSIYFNCIGEQGNSILGLTAEQVKERMTQMDNYQEQKEYLNQFKFRQIGLIIRAKAEQSFTDADKNIIKYFVSRCFDMNSKD